MKFSMCCLLVRIGGTQNFHFFLFFFRNIRTCSSWLNSDFILKTIFRKIAILSVCIYVTQHVWILCHFLAARSVFNGLNLCCQSSSASALSAPPHLQLFLTSQSRNRIVKYNWKSSFDCGGHSVWMHMHAHTNACFFLFLFFFSSQVRCLGSATRLLGVSGIT